MAPVGGRRDVAMDTQKTPERDPPGQASFVPVRKSAGDQVMSRLVNPVVRRVLRSPLHDLISGSMPEVPRARRGRQLWWTWFKATTLGEVVGFCVPAVTAPLVVGVGVWFVETPAIVLAGTVEGALLGLGQAYALRQALPGIRTREWVRATAAGAALAWLIGMAPATVGQQLWDVSEPLAVGLAAAGVAVLLSSIGLLQWRVLRRHVARAGRWVPATAGAWIAGLLGFTAVTSPLWRAGQPAVLVAAIGVLGAVVMAATVAAITGLALVRLLPPPIGQEE